MSQVDRILDVIDAGAGMTPSQVAGPISTATCARQKCRRPPDDGHDFCTPCLAWLRFEADDDPLDSEPDPDDPEVALAAWVALYGGT